MGGVSDKIWGLLHVDFFLGGGGWGLVLKYEDQCKKKSILCAKNLVTGQQYIGNLGGGVRIQS